MQNVLICTWTLTEGGEMLIHFLRMATVVLSVLPFLSEAYAFPRGPDSRELHAAALKIPTPQKFQVRLQCDSSRCLDRATGDYTASSCDRRGCRPSSGVVGNIYGRPVGRPYGSGYGDYGRGYPPRRYHGPQPVWDCNQNRCLDRRTGAYTASSCDWDGCRPSSGIIGYSR